VWREWVSWYYEAVMFLEDRGFVHSSLYERKFLAGFGKNCGWQAMI
jgi:hypothetical protein